jgi:methionyl-tRNA synthetase
MMQKDLLADRFVMGLPKMWQRGSGDQCEKCGSTLNATDLINPKSTITGETPIMKGRNTGFAFDRYEDFERMDSRWTKMTGNQMYK